MIGGRRFCSGSSTEGLAFRSTGGHGTPPSSSLVGVIFPSGKGRLRVDSNTRSRFQYLHSMDRVSIARMRCRTVASSRISWEVLPGR